MHQHVRSVAKTNRAEHFSALPAWERTQAWTGDETWCRLFSVLPISQHKVFAAQRCAIRKIKFRAFLLYAAGLQMKTILVAGTREKDESCPDDSVPSGPSVRKANRSWSPSLARTVRPLVSEILKEQCQRKSPAKGCKKMQNKSRAGEMRKHDG